MRSKQVQLHVTDRHSITQKERHSVHSTMILALRCIWGIYSCTFVTNTNTTDELVPENSSNFELINILSNARLEPFTGTEVVKHLFYRLTSQVKPENMSAVSEMFSRTVTGQLPKSWTSIPK